MRLATVVLCLAASLASATLNAQGLCDVGPSGDPSIRQAPYAALCESQYGLDPTTISDFFSTTSWRTNQIAVDIHGYHFNGIIPYLEGREQPGSVPLYRFYSPGGHAHYYTTSAGVPQIAPFDWKAEGIEGYVYTQQVPGSWPLYRHVRTAPNLAYKLSWSATSTGLPGFVRDGSTASARVGYAFEAQAPAELAFAAKTRLLQRCKYGDATYGCTGVDTEACKKRVRGGWIRNNATSRPAGTNTHTLRFDFRSNDYFGSGRIAHFTAATRARSITQGTPCINESNPTQQGLGVLVGRSGAVGCLGFPHPSVVVEAFFDGGNALLPQSCAGVALTNGTLYRLTITSRDDGYFKYVLEDRSTGSVLKTFPGPGDPQNLTYLFPQGTFPTTNSGHWIVSTADPNANDYTVDITNVTSSWFFTTPGTPLG